MSETNLPNRQEIVQLIMNTPPAQIASLPFVKDKFIQNYNACNPGNQGEMMYHRQQIHFTQAIMADDKTGAALRACNPFSLYAVFATAAANGYSLDPADNTVYIIPKGGVARLWRQAGAHVHRLMRTNQIAFADQVQIVYAGDNFVVSKGDVKEHDSKFTSEQYLAAYQRFELPDGKSRYFVYRPSDWNLWRSKSDVPDGANWKAGPLGQPDAGFLRTKVTKHACMEKVWATGMQPIIPQEFQDVEIESDAPLDMIILPTAQTGNSGNSSNSGTIPPSPVLSSGPGNNPAQTPPAGIGSTLTTPKAAAAQTDNDDF